VASLLVKGLQIRRPRSDLQDADALVDFRVAETAAMQELVDTLADGR
jgi:hypothetical protein